MAKTKQQKNNDLQKLEDKITKAKSLVFVGYNKVKIGDQEKLRKGLKKEKGEFLVTKKTLLNIALKDLKIDNAVNLEFDKEVALAFGYEDEIMPARLVAQVARSAENLKIKGGLLEKKLVAIEKIKFLASLPSKQVLQAKFLGTLKAPISGLANVLQGNLRGLVYVLKAISEKTN
jgi:large subunit ribosomal protein L10